MIDFIPPIVWGLLAWFCYGALFTAAFVALVITAIKAFGGKDDC